MSDQWVKILVFIAYSVLCFITGLVYRPAPETIVPSYYVTDSRIQIVPIPKGLMFTIYPKELSTAFPTIIQVWNKSETDDWTVSMERGQYLRDAIKDYGSQLQRRFKK